MGGPARRERRARLLGVAAALAAMAAFTLAIHWPAPAVSVGLGLAVYAWTRREGRPADSAERSGPA